MTEMTQEQVAQTLKTLGSCEQFPTQAYLDVMNFLTAYDEPMRALKMLDMVPAFYRDNPIPEMKATEKEIYQKLATPHFYSQNIWDKIPDDIAERGQWTLKGTMRGLLIHEDVKKMNAEGLKPHIIDLGPGEYWLPYGLEAEKCDFTYEGLGLQNHAYIQAKKDLEHVWLEAQGQINRPVIFIACELIEHLHHEADIKTDLLRTGATPSIIHISTPRYTFDGRHERLEWRSKGDLGHLRTYTPREFMETVAKMFPEYQWAFADGVIMHMKGTLKNGVVI